MRDIFFLNMKIDLTNCVSYVRGDGDGWGTKLLYIFEEHLTDGTIRTSLNHSAMSGMKMANEQFDKEGAMCGFKDVKRKITRKATFFEYGIDRTHRKADKVRMIYFTEDTAKTIPTIAKLMEER